MNCDFEEGRIALSYPVDDTGDPRLDPIPAASNLVFCLTVSRILSADCFFLPVFKGLERSCPIEGEPRPTARRFDRAQKCCSRQVAPGFPPDALLPRFL